ncbi:MAG: PKD domain-containing protein [Bacteroidetes bacterium]|nr:PKD domain-containing protein [Bacteroidota bacterium]
MRKIIFLITLCISLTCGQEIIFAQCNNVDFETGNFNNWNGYYGYHQTSGYNPSITGSPTSGFPGGRFTIMTGAGNDPCGGFPVVCPTCGTYTLKLGNNSVGAQAEKITMSFVVTAATTSFTYQYAVVLEDPGHPLSDQPYFEIRMTDGGGNDIPCSYYYVAAGQGIAGFMNSGTCFGTIYKPWTTVNIDLTPYIGQTVTIQFIVADCSQTGHYGYCYIDASCVPFAIIQYDSLCSPGNPINIFAPSGAATYSWTPGGQTTPFIQVSTPGTYCVQMTSVQGCITNLCDQVSLYPGITADFTYTEQCSLIVNFSDATTGGVTNYWEWNFGDGSPIDYTPSPIHTFPTGNPYNVILKVETSNGCKDSIVKTVVPLFSPTASFTYSIVCFNTPTPFYDLSTGGVINQWSWNFGDPGSGANNTATTPNPTHTFTAPGNYTVQLDIGNTIGCMGTVTMPILVNPVPVVDFSAPAVCFSDTTQFTNLTTITSGSVISWNWNFGDPLSGGYNTSAVQNPTHIFTSPLVYTVTLTATSDSGCIANTSKPVTVFSLPVASFASSDVCLNATMNFYDYSSGSGLSWLWDFGDITTSTAQNPNHIYAAQGTYQVEITVTDLNGCTDDFTDAVEVFPLPVADFTTDSVCRFDTTHFSDLSVIPYGSISLRRWNFGDGSPASFLPNPDHVYPLYGTFVATLVVFSDRNCADTISKPVIVHPLPVPDFSATDVCLNDTTSFTDLSTIPTGSNVSWDWDFDDGNISNMQNPENLYAAYGIYNVKLIVTSEFSCVDSVTKQVDVYPLPVSSFLLKNICVYDSTQFLDASTVPYISVTGWLWDFGDMGTSSLQNPWHKYAAPGTYIVTLQSTSNYGCTDVSSDTIIIHPEPVAGFSGNDICLEDTTFFTDLSSVTTGAIQSWLWDFGDISSSNLQNPYHIYGNFGLYQVQLTVTTDSGCVDSFTDIVEVFPLPIAFFSVAPVCSTQMSVFAESSAGNIVTWEWEFGDAAMGTSTLSDPDYYYISDGTYPVRLIVTTDKSCRDTFFDNAIVWPLPVVDFAGNYLEGCQPWRVDFSNLSYVPGSSIANQTWYFGDGDSASVFSTDHLYLEDGTYDVKLIVISNEGCVNSEEILNYITVYPKPNAEFIFNPNPTTILFPTIKFTDISDIPFTWDWDFGDGLIDSAQHPVHVYSDSGVYDVVLIVTTIHGCLDTAIHPVDIDPDFTFFAPNTFTPNKDGINDVFTGIGIGIRKYEMFIYDRWGDLIYKTDDINKPWDGKANNGQKMAQQDTYIWLVLITDVLNKKHRFIGHVNLLK